MIIVDDNGFAHDVIPRKEYEQRLKVDILAMIKELHLEIEEINYPVWLEKIDRHGFITGVDAVSDFIQSKIEKLEEDLHESGVL